MPIIMASRWYPSIQLQQEFLFLDANDGGLAFSLDAGRTFTQSGDTWFQSPGNGGTTNTPLRGLNTSQFYGMDKMNGARRYIGGTQDNGTWISPFDPQTFSTWISAPSGDGFEAAWNYSDTDKIIESFQFNGFIVALMEGHPGAFFLFLERPARLLHAWQNPIRMPTSCLLSTVLGF